MPYGGSGDVLINTIALTSLVIRDSSPQSLIQQDGTPASETVVDFGSDSNTHISCVNGVFTLLSPLNSLLIVTELHATKSGGGDDAIYLWAETSSDGGTTWESFPESLRHNVFDKDGDRIIVADWSVTQVFPAGLMFRIMASADSNQLTIEKPDDIVVSTNGVGGFAKKITIRTI